jgi:hypothetical protein
VVGALTAGAATPGTNRTGIPPVGESPSDAFFDLHLFGLRRRALDAGLTVLVVALVIASRWAAFPASIWEQDEAYFASAAVTLDVADHHPHPPWFPLWIGVGHVLHHGAGFSPAVGLQIASAVLSVWMVFPMTAFWSRLMARREAVLASLLFLFSPAPWWFSGRGFTGTAATALLLLALALWLDGGRRRIAAGGSAALAILVRPHVAVVVGGISVWLAWRSRKRSDLTGPSLVAIGVVAAGTIAFAVAAGGVAPLSEAFGQHWGYHFGALDRAELTFSGSGLARSLVHPWVAGLWVVLAAAGLVRSRKGGAAWTMATIATGTLLALILVLSNPAHARYFVPVLALTSGFVVTGCRRWAVVVVPVAVAASALWVGPQLGEYRTAVSPPLAALRQAAWEAHQIDGILVVDRTLASFVDFERARGRLRTTVVPDALIVAGATAPPPAARTVAVFDHGRDQLLLNADQRVVFSATLPAARRLAQDRFLDVTVARHATLDNPHDVPGPFAITR